MKDADKSGAFVRTWVSSWATLVLACGAAAQTLANPAQTANIAATSQAVSGGSAPAFTPEPHAAAQAGSDAPTGIGTGAADASYPIAVVQSCEVPHAPDPASVVAEEDVAYGPASRQTYDFVYPTRGATRGVVAIVHGGGWTSGSKRLFRKTLDLLAGEGFVAAAMNYRLAATAAVAFPTQISDVRCALRSIIARAHSHGSGAHLAVIGASAGGHLAVLLGAASAVTTFDDGSCSAHETVRPDGIVAYYPPLLLDTARTRYVPIMNQAVDEFLRAPDEATWRARAHSASPLSYVSGATPAILLIHGDADPIVPAGDSDTVAQAVLRAGGRAHVVHVEGGKHGFGVLSPAKNLREATCSAWTFLRQTAR